MLSGGSEKRAPDLFILMPMFLLLAAGIIIVYTSSSYLALAKGLTEFHFFFRHITRVFAAIIAMIVMFLVPVEFWQKHATRIFIGTAILLVLLFFLGKTVYGARRWISLAGFSFQPSDLAKLSLIAFLASFIAGKKQEIKSFTRGFLPGLGAVGVLVGLVLIQPDLSTSALLALVGVSMLFLGGVKPGHLLLAALAAIGVIFAAVNLFPHAKRRVQSFAEGGGYQVVQAQIGLAEGGLVGVGPGKGKEKFLYLPEPHTDFIYAVVGEEFGLWGSLAVLGLLALLALRGLFIANRLLQKSVFHGLLAAGAALIIGFYGLAHISVVVGLLPPTGLALPFVSYGGSSLLVYSAAAGLLLNLSKVQSQWSYS